VAPTQVVIVPIPGKDGDDTPLRRAHGLFDELAGTARVRLDDREGFRPGYKFADHELRGVPIRLELGPRDLEADQVTVVRRDTGEKSPVPLGRIAGTIGPLLEEIQAMLLADARAFADEHSFEAASYDELKDLIADPGGFVSGLWCADDACELTVKEDTKATIRYLPLDPEPVSGACVVCGAAATERATWAIAY
jgi:prolyl-tRNA synthetase